MTNNFKRRCLIIIIIFTIKTVLSVVLCSLRFRGRTEFYFNFLSYPNDIIRRDNGTLSTVVDPLPNSPFETRKPSLRRYLLVFFFFGDCLMEGNRILLQSQDRSTINIGHETQMTILHKNVSDDGFCVSLFRV